MAGFSRFENYRTTERSGTMDTMIQVIYIVFVDQIFAGLLFLFTYYVSWGRGRSDKCLTNGIYILWEILVFGVSKGGSGKC